MIKQLKLINWRNYEDATIEFGPGTTFVVASNGVGKTSLVEAARWALFGIIGSGGNAAVRVGAASAQAIVDLELPDHRILTVKRELVSKPRSSGIPPTVLLDGVRVPHEELNQYLNNAYGTEAVFLAGLTMPAVDRYHENPSALHLEEHLGRYYGIDGLRSAINQLKTMKKANESRIKRTKDANSTSSQRLARLQADQEQTAHQVIGATERHRAMQDKVERAQARERLKADLQKWQDNHSNWTETVARLAERVSNDLGRPVTADSVEKVLDERLTELDQQIETVNVTLAINVARETALVSNEARLTGAHDDCPICRRPLDDATVASAHEANLQELATLRHSILELKAAQSDLFAQRERVKAAQIERRGIRHPGEPPQSPADEEPIPADKLAAMAETALSARVEAAASHVQATRELAEARAADEAMRELKSFFRQEASLRVAIEATEATLTQLLNETIRPLAVEVDQRWKSLFPDRGDVNTYSNGNITRMVNGHVLPYDSFSTGESMGATIVLRLLVAQMATMADFCWFDEPLEHLDPDVRRKVASLLSRVTSGEGSLRQVVVTTYEEPLARQLRARDQQRVTLLDVRQVG